MNVWYLYHKLGLSEHPCEICFWRILVTYRKKRKNNTLPSTVHKLLQFFPIFLSPDSLALLLKTFTTKPLVVRLMSILPSLLSLSNFITLYPKSWVPSSLKHTFLWTTKIGNLLSIKTKCCPFASCMFTFSWLLMSNGVEKLGATANRFDL